MLADYRSDGKRPVAARGLILKTAVTYARLYIKGSHSPPQNQTFITSQQNFRSLHLALIPLPSFSLLPPDQHRYSEGTLSSNTQASFKSVSCERDTVRWSCPRLDLVLCSTSVSTLLTRTLLFQISVFGSRQARGGFTEASKAVSSQVSVVRAGDNMQCEAEFVISPWSNVKTTVYNFLKLGHVFFFPAVT